MHGEPFRVPEHGPSPRKIPRDLGVPCPNLLQKPHTGVRSDYPPPGVKEFRPYGIVSPARTSVITAAWDTNRNTGCWSLSTVRDFLWTYCAGTTPALGSPTCIWPYRDTAVVVC